MNTETPFEIISEGVFFADNFEFHLDLIKYLYSKINPHEIYNSHFHLFVISGIKNYPCTTNKTIILLCLPH